MKNLFKTSLSIICLSFSLLLSGTALGQSSCCNSKSQEKTTCCSTKASSNEKTSGCTPSNCRGEKTKFGEAKVITELRTNLIALKATMENNEHPKFDRRTYEIHGIVGESDDESLKIIKNEVLLIEKNFEEKLETVSFVEFVLPDSKSKQVKYLAQRISHLKTLL